MKILLINYFNAENRIGGVEHYLHELMQYAVNSNSTLVFKWFGKKKIKNSWIEKFYHKKITQEIIQEIEGFEDFVFLKTLEKNKIKIQQIENNCIHQNEETSEQFINKYHHSLQNLYQLIQSGKLDYENTYLSSWYLKFKKIKLDSFLAFSYKKFEKLILKNLKSKYCSLFLFDFYKLGYFCTLNKHKNV